MKKMFVIVLFAFFSGPVAGQNLVVNPGLDGFITCPGFGQFSSAYIISWDKPTIASSDYYHYNCAGIQPVLQAPHSGEGYAGIICYNFGTEYREYITGTFSTPLTAGVLYDVEFWVSLHDGYIQAIEEIGAYISVTAPGPFSNVLHINVTPQIQNISGALNDTANWKRVNGQFTATGGEQFITIGNFNDDAGTTITQPGSSGSFGAYYFVDDVSVKIVNTVSIDNFNNAGITIFSPAKNQLQIQLPDNYSEFPVVLEVYDAASRLLIESNLVSNNTLINLPDFESQLLLVVISGEPFCYRRKVMMSR